MFRFLFENQRTSQRAGCLLIRSIQVVLNNHWEWNAAATAVIKLDTFTSFEISTLLILFIINSTNHSSYYRQALQMLYLARGEHPLYLVLGIKS